MSKLSFIVSPFTRFDYDKNLFYTDIKLYFMQDSNIKMIISRKRQGIDCTEQESAEIKGWLRELRMVGDQDVESEIQELFPIEYGEYLDEILTKH